MRKIAFVVLFFGLVMLLSPVPVQALAPSPTPTKFADGKNKPRKRSKKVVRKTSSVKVAPKQPVVPANPVVQIYGSVEGEQLIVNIYWKPLFTQNMFQQGDKIDLYGVQSGPVSAETNAKDRQVAERFVKELKTTQAFFMRAPPTKKSAEVNTIALNKGKWTEADVAIVQKILTELYAPQQVGFTSVAIVSSKSLLLPGQLAVQNPQ